MSLKEVISRLNQVFSNRREVQSRTDTATPIPEKTRNKLLLLYLDIVAGFTPGLSGYIDLASNDDFLPEIHNLLQYKIGSGTLSELGRRSGILIDGTTRKGDLLKYLAECSTVEFLDFLELSFHVAHPPVVGYDSSPFIDALNEILEGEAAPYRLTDFSKIEEEEEVFNQRRTFIRIVAWPQVIETSDEVTYQEAVKPALAVLDAPDCQAPNQEFLKGMQHFRMGEYGDCLTACGSAVESIIKVICTRHGWHYGANNSLSALIDNVVPRLNLDSTYKERFKVLTTPRNRLGSAHGGGTVPRRPERHVAQFMVTTSAAVIVFLVSESDGMRGRR